MDLQQFFGANAPPREHFISVLEHWAETQPKKQAYVFTDVETIEEQLTYEQLWTEVRALAGYLQKRCRIRSGDRVLLLYPPGLDFIVGFFACQAAGAIAVPVFPPRRNRKASRIRSIVVDANARWALSTKGVVEQLAGDQSHDDLIGLQLVGTDGPECRDLDAWRQPKRTENSLALLQYTSGSTGSPKGVVLSQGNLIANSELILQAFQPGRDTIGMSWLPTYHDMGLVGGVLMPMYIGKKNVLTSPMTFLQRPLRWLQGISKYGVTTSGGPNFGYQLCADKVTDEEIDQLDLSTWKIAFNGAEPIRSSTLTKFAQRFERCGFDPSAMLPCYGMAETTLIVTGGPEKPRPISKSFDAGELVQRRVKEVDAGDEHAKMMIGCGAVLDGEEVVIVDPDTHVVQANDRIGEIWVSSPSVGKGYYQREEATNRTFKAETADGRGPFLRTGDLGFLYDGQLYVSGRLKDMIIVRGVNRYPQDVEETVEHASDVVQAGSVGAVAMEHDGREQLVIVAEAVRKRDLDWDSEIQAIRRAVTAEHELPPDAVYLVRNSSIPKTSSGKIQRHACLHAVRDNDLKLVAKWVRWEENSVATFGSSGGQTMMQAAAAGGSAGQIDHADVTDSIAQVVMHHVSQIAGDRATGLDYETNIVLDLGLDSLERLEIARNLERTFGGRFPEQVLDEIETIAQTALAIERYLRPGAEQRAELFLADPLADKNSVPGEFSRPQTLSGTDASDRASDVGLINPEVEPEDSFEQFGEYQRLKSTMQQMLITGVPNPYFTVHDAVVGDTTLVNGKELISFASYNYLGLSGHPAVSSAAADAVQRYGTSVSASRLVSGEKPIHGQLEKKIAKWIGVDDSILMVGGHATNETTIGHLVSQGDLIVHDSLAHNSIVQGALLSGARRRPFPHNDFEALDRLLAEVRGQYRRVLIAIEGVYSMDGDFSNVPEFIRVKKKHRALLMVDEAHSFGTMGDHGRGMAEHFGFDASDVDIWMGTLSKSAASCGGYIAGSKALVELLRYTAPGFVFSVGMPPAQVAAAMAAIETLEREPDRITRLRDRSSLFLQLCTEAGLDTGDSGQTPVVPVITGNSMVALRLSNRLKADGVNVQPILYPAVDESAARLRFFITSEHSEKQIRFTVERMVHHMEELGHRSTAKVSGD